MLYKNAKINILICRHSLNKIEYNGQILFTVAAAAADAINECFEINMNAWQINWSMLDDNNKCNWFDLDQ